MTKTLQGVAISLFFAGLVIELHYLIFYLLRSNGSFDLKTIEVQGSQAVSRNEILHASGLQQGMYMFSIDLEQTAQKIRRISLLQSVQVRKQPPDTILISVTEREIIAQLQTPDRTVFCDAGGYILPVVQTVPATRIRTDFSVRSQNGRIQEEFLLAALQNLDRFDHRADISQIVLRQKEGAYIFLKGLDTTFFLGNKLPSLEMLKLVYSLGETIRKRGLKISYVDVNKENPIGYKSQ